MRLLLSALVIAATVSPAAPPERPRVTGLAHVALFVHDVERARVYYRDFLGYAEVPPITAADGRVRPTRFAVNDRQVIEIVPERGAGTDRLDHVAFETDDAEGLRVYLGSRGVGVPTAVTPGSGGATFSVKDPDGHVLEFIQHPAAGPRTGAASLGANRISPTMSHAGILVGSLAKALEFYRDLLGFRETWRGSRDGKTLDWVNLQLPDGQDYLEFMLYRDLPAETARGSQHHVCLVVPDIQAAADRLAARAAAAGYSRPLEVRTGINRKRQLNLFDPDGTRSELMEPVTIDGQPAPSSAAPAPR